MKYRIIKESETLYIPQQRKRFLFWTYWGNFEDMCSDELIGIVAYHSLCGAESFLNSLNRNNEVIFYENSKLTIRR